MCQAVCQAVCRACHTASGRAKRRRRGEAGPLYHRHGLSHGPNHGIATGRRPVAGSGVRGRHAGRRCGALPTRRAHHIGWAPAPATAADRKVASAAAAAAAAAAVAAAADAASLGSAAAAWHLQRSEGHFSSEGRFMCLRPAAVSIRGGHLPSVHTTRSGRRSLRIGPRFQAAGSPLGGAIVRSESSSAYLEGRRAMWMQPASWVCMVTACGACGYSLSHVWLAHVAGACGQSQGGSALVRRGVPCERGRQLLLRQRDTDEKGHGAARLELQPGRHHLTSGVRWLARRAQRVRCER